MVEFLVETYAPYETPSAAARNVEAVSRAAAQINETGAEVRLQRAIFLPEDDISFYLFQASSAAAVRDAITRAGLRSDRITEALSIDTKPTPFLEEGQTKQMPHVDKQKQPTTRPAIHPPSRPVVPHRRTRAARQPNPPAATPGPAGPLAMRWSTGPDGRLCCAWQPPIPWGTDEIVDPVGCRRTGLAASERPTLAREPMREALAAY